MLENTKDGEGGREGGGVLCIDELKIWASFALPGHGLSAHLGPQRV